MTRHRTASFVAVRRPLAALVTAAALLGAGALPGAAAAASDPEALQVTDEKVEKVKDAKTKGDGRKNR